MSVVFRPLCHGILVGDTGKIVRKGNADWYFYRKTRKGYSVRARGPFISAKEAASKVGGEVVRK